MSKQFSRTRTNNEDVLILPVHSTTTNDAQHDLGTSADTERFATTSTDQYSSQNLVHEHETSLYRLTPCIRS